MTSKISYFDRAVFLRALKKTAPVWALFTLYQLLLPVQLYAAYQHYTIQDYSYYNYTGAVQAGVLEAGGTTLCTIVMCLYGLLLAWVLFRWLFSTSRAYFVASLPVRRPTIFLTIYAAALLVCAVPVLLSALLSTAAGALLGVPVFSYAMQAAAASMLEFLFFFSFASLLCMVIGQMAAMPVVYLILNVAVIVVESIVQSLLQTFVYGMPPSLSGGAEAAAEALSPLYYLLQGGVTVASNHLAAGSTANHLLYDEPRLFGWQYLLILAGVGVLFALLAFWLLKTREMERCGDVIAIRQLRPVALYVFTIGCALVICALVMQLFPSNAAYSFWAVLVFLFLGAAVGYFFARMMLNKTIHVFRHGWLGLGVCCLALFVTFGAAKADLFGYSRQIPEEHTVASAGLTMRQHYGQSYMSQDPEFIESVIQLHTRFVEERTAQDARRVHFRDGTDSTQAVYISYRLKNGKVLQRYYDAIFTADELSDSGSLIADFASLYNSPTCILVRTGFDAPRTQSDVWSCDVVFSDSRDTQQTLGTTDAWLVYDACVQDILDGTLGAEDVRPADAATVEAAGEDANYAALWLVFSVDSGIPGQKSELYVDSVPIGASHTIAALESLGIDPHWQIGG